ncbi:MAG: tagaturonate epimerase family protein [Microbacterium sp.]
MTLGGGVLQADVIQVGRRSRLLVRVTDAARLAPFQGRSWRLGDEILLEGPADATNAAALRHAIPTLRPQPLGQGVSAGTGDRLGTATCGHARAFRHHGAGVTPVFAQQSFREMDRLGRSPQNVLDDATYGCVAGGWDGPVGADADHIHDISRLGEAVAAGFTTFTLDPGDAVRDAQPDTGTALAGTDWTTLQTDRDETLRRYSGIPVDLGRFSLTPSDEDVIRAIAKYANAVALISRMHDKLAELATAPYEVEIAIDETTQPTSLFEHHYFAAEAARLGVHWASMAPRYIDGFEKGVEYRGDVDALAENVAGHRAVAVRNGGYKISMHSGSDKFSIYERVIAAADGRIHLKTSGTSWLCAVEVLARRAPVLFRQVHEVSSAAYREARASYQVSAAAGDDHISSIPDGDLESLVHADGTRQVLHVGYGAVLTASGHDGPLDGLIRDVLSDHRDEYLLILENHIGRHLLPFSAGGAR